MSAYRRFSLSDVSEFSNGYAFKSEDLRSAEVEGYIPIIKMGHIVKGGGFNKGYKTQYVPPDKAPPFERFGARQGDILMCMTDMKASLNLLGYSALFAEEDRYLINQRVGCIRPTADINGKYLFYYLNTTDYVDRIRSTAVGGVQTNLSSSSIKASVVYLPDRKTQDDVADCLSAYDDLIENNKRRMSLLEEAARLVYEEWFIRLRFPGHEHTKIINGTPEGWEPKVLGDICSEIRETVSPENVEADSPYIGLEHMPRRSIALSEWGKAAAVTSSKHAFKTGDILFGKIRPYFHKVGIAFTDGVASSDAIVIRANPDELRTFVLMTVSSDKFVAESSQTMREGSKMPRADWKLMTQYPIAMPPQGLLETFSESVTAVTDQLRTLTFQKQRLRGARDLLLPRLMSGEITV